MTGEVLIVDDDLELTRQLTQFLEPEGYSVCCVHNGKAGVKKALNHPFDAIILDVILPEMTGFEILKAIRQHSDTPVLMLTARADDIDRIVCLEIGADDYIPKPCNPRELIARLRAILRRTQKAVVHKPVIEHLNILIDCGTRIASVSGKILDLTKAEFKILEMLIKSPGQAFSKEELTEHALSRKYTAYDRSIDVHVSNLRNKLGEKSENSPLIKTVRGFGYLIEG